MLIHRLRRWFNIKQTVGQHAVFTVTIPQYNIYIFVFFCEQSSHTQLADMCLYDMVEVWNKIQAVVGTQ